MAAYATATGQPVGLSGHVSAWIGANLGYLRARLELAGLEGKEAAVHFALVIAMAISAGVLALFAYLLLILALVFLVASFFPEAQHAWIWVMFGAALLHVLGAGALVWMAQSRLKQRMFVATLGEFKKDQEWLKNPANPN